MFSLSDPQKESAAVWCRCRPAPLSPLSRRNDRAAKAAGNPQPALGRLRQPVKAGEGVSREAPGCPFSGPLRWTGKGVRKQDGDPVLIKYNNVERREEKAKGGEGKRKRKRWRAELKERLASIPPSKTSPEPARTSNSCEYAFAWRLMPKSGLTALKRGWPDFLILDAGRVVGVCEIKPGIFRPPEKRERLTYEQSLVMLWMQGIGVDCRVSDGTEIATYVHAEHGHPNVRADVHHEPPTQTPL